jgi:hypothetical protein
MGSGNIDGDSDGPNEGNLDDIDAEGNVDHLD